MYTIDIETKREEVSILYIYIYVYFDLQTPFWETFIKLETRKECKQNVLRVSIYLGLGVTFMHFTKAWIHIG